MRRTLVLVLTGAVLIAGLTGCTVQLTAPGAGDSSAPSQVAPAAPAPSSTAASPTTGADRPSGAPDADGEAGDSAARADAVAAASVTIACAPGLLIDQTARIVRVEGACDDVTITADAAVVVLDDVASLRVDGDGNRVFARTVGELAVAGDANGVRWTGEAPRTAVTGDANVVGRDE